MNGTLLVRGSLSNCQKTFLELHGQLFCAVFDRALRENHRFRAEKTSCIYDIHTISSFPC